MRALVRWLTKEFRGQVVVGLVLFILSACTAPTHPTTQPLDPPLANLQTCRPANLQTSKLAHLHQAAYNYARYHALALRQISGQDSGQSLEGAVNIGCPQYVTVDELVAAVIEVSGKEIHEGI